MSEQYRITKDMVTAAFEAMNNIDEKERPEEFHRAHIEWKAIEADYIRQERAKAAQDD